MKIWVVKGGERLGPYTEEEVTRRLGSGEIAWTDLAWVQGMPGWAPLSQVLGGGPTVQAPSVAPAAPPSPVYAGFWLRFVAFLLDALILSVPTGCLAGAFAMHHGWHGQLDLPREACRLADLCSVPIWWLYFSLMESSSLQATVGKLAVRIKVTDENGMPLSFARATARHFGKFVSAIILFIGFMMAGFTERKQALHDMMASCLVVRR